MRWKKLRVAYIVCLMLLAISLTFLLTPPKHQESMPPHKVAPTTSTSLLDRPPPTAPQTTTTTTTAPPPTTTTSQASTYQAASVSEPGDVWDIIARCETPPNGDWGYRGTYEGGLQFAPSTWTAYVAAGKPYGLAGYPAHAYDASREQQITVAIRVRDGVKGSSDPYLNPQGWNAWPTCRHKAGV